MRLRVRHTTTYAFAHPATLTVQAIRLTPQPFDGLAVLSWHVRSDKGTTLPSFVDGYGNLVHLLTRRGRHEGVSIVVDGEAETEATDGLVGGATETLPPTYYLRQTALTAPDAAIDGLARQVGGDRPADAALAETLMQAVAERVTYTTGVTDSGTTAAAALKAGAGVCQDHAHILCAAARVLGIPARYVSGYLWTGVDHHEDVASHAWTELWLEGSGWIGFDAASRSRAGDRHLRLAIGLDYAEAAPVRGNRLDQGDEKLSVRVRVDRLG